MKFRRVLARLRNPSIVLLLGMLFLWPTVARAFDPPLVGRLPAAEYNPSVAQAIDRLREVAGVAPFQTTRIFDRHGNLLYEIADRGRRTIVSLDQIPETLIQATIATEDRNFYQNSGIDLNAIARAAWQNFRAGEIVSGGSTITQQLARLLLLEEEARYEQSLTRKVREAALALRLSQRYSKDEILEMYLNTVYYGHQAYGVGEAAWTYFNKPVSELTLAESALLVGLPQAPNYLDPFVTPEAARERQRVVLGLMRREGYIDEARMAAALAEELRFVSPRRGVLLLPHFVDYVRDLLLERYGQEGTRQGLQVYTSIDLRYQELAETIVRAQVAQIGPRHDLSNGAVVILHPPTGQILVMVGSLSYYDEGIDGQVNVAVRRRQVGSAIKPVLYAAALDNGWTPASVVWDTPARYPLVQGRWYSPRNITGRFYGPLRLRGALANSLNVSAVKLLNELGVDQMLETARALGITSWRAPEAEYGLSLAVGGYEVTLLELTHAYATLANSGAHVPLAGVVEVRDMAGRVLFHALPPDPPHYAVSPVAAYQVSSILSDARSRQMLFGRNSALDVSQPAAVKTGTTDGWRDNVAVGYTPYLAVGVWLGNSDGRLMREAPGYRTAGPVWHDIMEAIWADPALHDSLGYAGELLPQGFQPPPGVYTASICELLPGVFNRTCPLVYEEVFALAGGSGGVRAAPTSATVQSDQQLGYCLPAVQADLPEAVQRVATFVPLPDDPQDAAAARRWASNYGLALRQAGECDLTPVVRPLAEQPPRPEPQRLIDIPEPAGEGDESAVAAGPLRPGGRARLSNIVRALNIRAEPGIEHPVVGHLLPDQVVDVLEGPRQVGSSPWFQIRQGDAGVTGWVNGSYLRGISPPAEGAEEPDEKAPAVVAPGEGVKVGGHAQLVAGLRGLNIRTGPGVDNPVIDYVRLEDVVLVQDGPQTVEGSHWYAILVESREVAGWVNGRYLIPQDTGQ